MYGQTISDLLARFGAEALTDLSIVVMVALFAVSLLLAAIGVCRRFTVQGATLLTSLGILGTFGGIVVGLYGFDSSPGRIDASVQVLLDGLKTAFTSSLIGMALAVAYKLLLTVPPFASREHASKDAPTTVAGTLEAMLIAVRQQASETTAIREALEVNSSEKLAKQLHDVSSTLEQGFGELNASAQAERRLLKLQCETLDRLHASLVDDDDASLAGQLRGLRTELSDRDRSHRGKLDTLVRLGEGQTECAQGLLDAQRDAAAVRGRTEMAIVAMETASRNGAAALTETLPKMLEASADVAAAANRLDERVQGAIEKAEALSTQGNATLVRLLDTIGPDASSGMAAELRHMREGAEKSREVNSSSFERLIGLSENEATLLGDALVLGQTGLDGAARMETLLQDRMEEIAGLLSRSPTEEIIEALKTTIREFNEHIAEQFGDNFKQLNQAVGRLLDWQENYREQLDGMSRQYAAGVQAITDTERSVDEISRHSATIPAHMEKLGTVLAANDAELGQLRDHLAAFVEAREQAVRAVPEITKIVGDTVRQLDEAGRSLSGGVQSSAGMMTSAIQKSAEDYTRMADTVNGRVQTIAQRTQDETARLFDSLEASIKKAYRLTSESTENLVKQEFSQMETAREEQVKRVMEEMGVALASITGKFTEDYVRLVDAMDRVVRSGDVPGREAA